MSKLMTVLYEDKMCVVWGDAQAMAVEAADKTEACLSCERVHAHEILIVCNESKMCNKFIEFLREKNIGEKYLNSDKLQKLEYEDIMPPKDRYRNLTCRRVRHECFEAFRRGLAVFCVDVGVYQ